MYVITAEQLHAAVPSCAGPDTWVPHIHNATLMFGIALDANELAEFLAQCAHESLGFNRLNENLSYTAERLVEVWPTRFPSSAVAAQYARNPHKLADFVYSNRMGNGDYMSGDGWQYRGRGLIMITGRANYRAVGEAMGDSALLHCPDRLETKAGATLAAGAFWHMHPRLRQLARDLPGDNDEADLVSMTRIVNGSTQGLAERRSYRNAFRSVLGLPSN